MSRTLLPAHELPSIGSILSSIASKETSAQEIVKESLDAINSYDHELNSLTAVNGNALKEAEELDVSSSPRLVVCVVLTFYLTSVSKPRKEDHSTALLL